MENGVTMEGGAVFFLNPRVELFLGETAPPLRWRQNSATGGGVKLFWLYFFSQCHKTLSSQMNHSHWVVLQEGTALKQDHGLLIVYGNETALYGGS